MSKIEMEFKIEYWEKKSQSIKIKQFKTYELAEKWGRKNLTNFNHDLIRSVIL